MGITINLPNSVPHIINSGMATKILGSVIPSPLVTPTNDICLCEFSALECTYLETVFAELGGQDYKNDKNSFLFRRLVPADTVVIKLFKSDVEVAVIVDDTYGTFFDGFTAQPLYKGFIIDWEKVLNLLGPGRYQVKADKSIVGVIDTFESQKFRLLPYSDVAANGTVVLKTIQSGNIIGSQFDYTGVNWEQQYRIRGKFGDKIPTLERDSYVTQAYVSEQIRDQITNEWTLETRLIPANISNVLIYDNLLANKFTCTDYNIFNKEVYRDIDLYPSEIETVDTGASTKSMYKIKFTDRVENTIKRNF